MSSDPAVFGGTVKLLHHTLGELGDRGRKRAPIDDGKVDSYGGQDHNLLLLSLNEFFK